MLAPNRTKDMNIDILKFDNLFLIYNSNFTRSMS